jgi:DNA topoisomerase I
MKSPRFHAAVARLLELPGRRLFQHRDPSGEVRTVRASEVNTFLQEIAGGRISLKDFRTLVASVGAVQALAATIPAESAAKRRRQLREAVVEIAEELANTPTVCRTSYVHERWSPPSRRARSSAPGSRNRRWRRPSFWRASSPSTPVDAMMGG